jgi:hypothetical protein
MAQRQAIKMEQKNKSVLQRETQAGQCAHLTMAVRYVRGQIVQSSTFTFGVFARRITIASLRPSRFCW